MDRESKPHYKIGEVCEMTGTQPYVLRFWESEFPSLAPEKNRSGQRIYRKRDIELIERIKTLLYEKEYTIAGARKVLDVESQGGEEEYEEDREMAGPASRAGAAEEAGSPGHALEARGTSVAAGADRPGPGGDLARPGDERSGTGAASGFEASSREGKRASRIEPRDPDLPFRALHSSDTQLETEVKNLRAKLARAEAELKAILADMDRHDQMK